MADNKLASVAVSTVTSASESMPIDIETSAYCEDVTSARFKEVAIQCDILHETSIGKGRLGLDVILPRFFLPPNRLSNVESLSSRHTSRTLKSRFSSAVRPYNSSFKH